MSSTNAFIRLASVILKASGHPLSTQFQLLFSEKPKWNRNGKAEPLNFALLCVQMWRPHLILCPFHGELEPGSHKSRGLLELPSAAWGQEGLRPAKRGI